MIRIEAITAILSGITATDFGILMENSGLSAPLSWGSDLLPKPSGGGEGRKAIDFGWKALLEVYITSSCNPNPNPNPNYMKAISKGDLDGCQSVLKSGT